MLDQTTATPIEVRKAEQYGWKVQDEPGRFNLINKNRLRIDHEYQRSKVNEARIGRIAKKFTWAKFGVLSVSERPDGTYVIFEGQHRWLAAKRIPSIGNVPCMIFPMKDVAVEAGSFLGVNIERGIVGSIDNWRASEIAGDETAKWVARLADDNNVKIDASRARGSLNCVAALLRLANVDRNGLEAVFPLVVELNGGEVIHERILHAIFYLYQTNGEKLLDRPIVDRLRALGRKGLLKAAQDASAYYSKGGAKVWASGITGEVNKRSRTNRLAQVDLTR